MYSPAEKRGQEERSADRAQRRPHSLSAEIDWIEAADYYVCLHTGGGSHLLRRTLADMEKDLEPNACCRIHRSTIVNLARVRELRTDANGEPQVVLSDATVLRLSRSYRHALQSLLGERKPER
jgi:two-component system, LytTR family, response regulator